MQGMRGRKGTRLGSRRGTAGVRHTVLLGSLALAGVTLSACGSSPATSDTTTTSAVPRTSTTKPPATTTSTTSTTSTTAPGAACVTPPTRWSATRIANQLLMVLGYFTSAASLAPEARAGAGGFVFLGEPAASQKTALHATLGGLDADAAGAGQVVPWMSTDTEGGTVSRLAYVLGSIPSARQMAAEWSTAQVESALETRGVALRQLGITMDLAPVIDTASPTDPVADESQRSFSATPGVVSEYASAFASGLRAGGVVAVGKHFPGLGHASANTDTGPSTDPSLAQLRSDDLIPFTRVVASGVPVVMVGHPMVPGLSGNLPASLSPATYSLLRHTLHFSGVAMTDSLGAGAISAAGYSQAAAAVAAVRSGADMPMVDQSTWQPAVAALVQAITAGTIPRAQVETSVGRILAAKGLTVCG
jgi:beta-N-acetylhexosaminidase